MESCSKCGGTEIDSTEIRMTGGGFSRFFDVQNQSFEAKSCSACGYTELYRNDDAGGVSSVLDFLFGG